MVFHRFHFFVHTILYIDNTGCRIRVNLEIEAFVVVDAHCNRQVQSHHGIAAVGGGERLGVVAGLAITLVVPDVAGVGAFNRELGGGGLPHVDRCIGNAVATCGIVAHHLVGACQVDSEGAARCSVAP